MEPGVRNSRDQWIGLGAVGVVAGLLLAHARCYMPFLADDALISLRYADRLIHGFGLTWTDGPRVEGYSNLMWVLLVAGLGKCGMDLIVAARLLGVGCMAAVIVFAAKRSASRLAFAAGAVFFVSAAPVAAWAIGGLEQPLVAAALAGAIFYLLRAADADYENRPALVASSLCLGVLCLTRPDGPLFTAAAVASPALAGLSPRRRKFWAVALTLASIPVACYGGQLLFRLSYYGEWIPNTARVKVTPSARHLAGGLEYAGKGLLSLMPAALVAIGLMVVGVARKETRGRMAPLAAMFALWTGYVVAMGGDVMPAYRHVVPLVVILTFALIEGVGALTAGGRRGAVAAALIVASAAVFPAQFLFAENARARHELWEWQGRSLALTLRDAFGANRPLLAVTAAGSLPYWTGFPSVDMLGLNDQYLARHKPADVGGGMLGHELGDAGYILRRAPDIIVFTAGSDPMYRYKEGFAAEPAFKRDYARMPVLTAYPPQYVGIVFFRKTSARLGYGRSGDTLTIPAHCLDAFGHTCAYLDGGRLVAGINATHPAGIVLERLPGRPRVTVLGPRPELVQCATTGTTERMQITLTTQSRTGVPIHGLLVRVDE